MINDKADEVLEELFQSILSRNQFGLETSKKVSDFIFDYKCHKINFKRDQLYIDFPD